LNRINWGLVVVCVAAVCLWLVFQRVHYDGPKIKRCFALGGQWYRGQCVRILDVSEGEVKP